MTLTHKLKLQHSDRRPITVTVVGAGGNGSAVLFGLAYLHQALLAWGHHYGLQVQVMDGDVVSPTNCVRQPFGIADVGQSKAITLVNRLNLFHGLAWDAKHGYFQAPVPGKSSLTCDFLISCVDTRKARKEIHDALFDKHGAHCEVGYWLDLGNNSSNGQFVLGQPADRETGRERLRAVTELYPDIMDTTLGEGDQPSCSAAEALERQEPFINQTLAHAALAMLTRLLRYGEINHHGAFYNAASGRMVPLPINPDRWLKDRRRRQRLAAQQKGKEVPVGA